MIDKMCQCSNKIKNIVDCAGGGDFFDVKTPELSDFETVVKYEVEVFYLRYSIKGGF
ncbi:hypothetical protein MHL31_05865 [Lutibacter sp. A80]|uniref:hypothetical protein n=1 Tax=Lutibacter sp. A80 TaxID=2918453 RepID=UPI001F0555DB|nr:hypothetical protein [Lutibacter sp. A80]UMB61730.1 hypothetical protein MHL31_05865 [Lutibacter sp. A80]